MTTQTFNNSADPLDRLAKADPAKTILVDCNGTLFMANGQANNMDLATRLLGAKRNGYDVFVFSNLAVENGPTLKWLDVFLEKKLLGTAREETMANRRDEDTHSLYFGEILDKGDAKEFYRKAGTKPFLIVDDEHSSHGMDATHKIGPMDFETFDKLTVPDVATVGVDANPAFKVA